MGGMGEGILVVVWMLEDEVASGICWGWQKLDRERAWAGLGWRDNERLAQLPLLRRGSE